MNTRGSKAIRAFILIVFLATMVIGSPPKNELHRVKKIYIEPTQTQPRLAWVSQMRTELTKVGFVVVDNTYDADAILDDQVQGVVVLDGPQPDPPERVYEFRLTLPNNATVWRTEFKIRSRLEADDVNKQAAKRFAGRLLDAWLKSARRVGLAVGDKVS
jgi:hypothetical protein